MRINYIGFVLQILLLLLISPVFLYAGEQDTGAGKDYSFNTGIPDLLGDEETEDGEITARVSDPLEPLNRITFQFNDKLYFWVLKPVKTGYSTVVPEDVRQPIGNFFNNLASPVDLINTILQGRIDDAGAVIARFAINSTIGVFGFVDAAEQAFDLGPREADFGQTLGVWGFGDGIYINWPVFGPSNVRDSIGLVADWYAHPYTYLDLDDEAELILRGTEFVNDLSISPDVYEELKKISLDPYVATRQAYSDYRRNLILLQKNRNEE